MCRRGNSRSVALAYLFKHKLKYEAIAVGLHQHSAETYKMLYDWADWIIVVDKKLAYRVPAEYSDKLKVWDVGSDRWFKGFDESLTNQFTAYIRRDGFTREDGPHAQQ